MSKARNPTLFSAHFAIDHSELDKLGVFDPTLAIDTKLFIDPLLFPTSRHDEMRTVAVKQYRQHFEKVIKFLVLTRSATDVAWRTARRLLEFHELRGTCLGYGTDSISGSGMGVQLTERLLRVAKEIVDLGVRDPDLFPAMALFEEKIGPDRISDMTTNVVREALAAFNRRVLEKLGLKGQRVDLNGVAGEFLENPFQKRRTPIILVPLDVLRKLPIAHDWDEVADAASKKCRASKEGQRRTSAKFGPENPDVTRVSCVNRRLPAVRHSRRCWTRSAACLLRATIPRLIPRGLYGGRTKGESTQIASLWCSGHPRQRRR